MKGASHHVRLEPERAAPPRAKDQTADAVLRGNREDLRRAGPHDRRNLNQALGRVVVQGAAVDSRRGQDRERPGLFEQLSAVESEHWDVRRVDHVVRVQVVCSCAMVVVHSPGFQRMEQA